MKKFLSISCICLVIILSFGFAGCATGNSNASLSYTLEYNINKLTNILNKTEEAKTSELIIPEIYSPNENTAPITPLKQGDLTTLPSIDRQIVSPDEIKDDQSKIMTRTSLSSSKIGTYNPRRLTNVNYTNSGYNSYLGKVEDLYVMVNDAVCVNDSICNCKNNILAYCEFLAEVAKQLKDNKIELSKEQTESCNSLLKELSKATNKLTDTRNEVSNSCKGLSQKKSLSNGIDTISSKYVTLVNCLDNRLTNYQNILALLAQLQCVLNGNCQTDSNISNDVLDNLKNLENLNDLLNGNNTNSNNSNNSNDKCFTDESGRTYCLDNDGNLYTRDEKGNRVYLKNCPNGTCNDNTTANNGNGTCNGNTVINDGNVVCPNANSTTNSTKTISSKNKVNPEKIADYNINDEEKTEKSERKSNIDTFKDKTVTPNVIKKENKKHDNTKQNTTENNTNQNNQNNQEIPIAPTPTQLPNNTNTYGYGNGVYGSPINGTYGNGTYGGAYGNGFGGVYGGGYNGMHNYENGITNPYRNTDTYKFPPQSSTQLPSSYAPGARLKTEAFQDVSMEKPLPQEKRQDFKAFGVAEPNVNLEKEDEIKTLEETNESKLSSKEPTEQRGEKIFDRLV